jgi:hypothetical protein
MRTLIEDCFALKTSLIKKDLKRAREKQPVEGFLNFRDNGRGSALDYSIEYSIDCNTYLVVNIYAETQKILLSEHPLRFGTRTYLTCGCGKRVNALYLKLGYFGCRNCQKLRYASTTINKSSDHGMMLYLNSKRLKLIDIKEEIPRVFYRSQYTKKFLRWLKLCDQAGLFREVRDAEKTMESIRLVHSQQF